MRTVLWEITNCTVNETFARVVKRIVCDTSSSLTHSDTDSPAADVFTCCDCCQMQEFRTGATKQNMETVHVKEETKRLRNQLTELRDKLAELDAKVGLIHFTAQAL